MTLFHLNVECEMCEYDDDPAYCGLLIYKLFVPRKP